MSHDYGRVFGGSSSAYSLRDRPADSNREGPSLGRMSGLLEMGSSVLRRVQRPPPQPHQTLPYRTPGGARWYASDDESNASGGETDELSNSSVASSCYIPPSIAPLPRDVLRNILVLVLEMDGSIGRVSTLSLVCRYWNAVLSEQPVWGRVAQLFVPSLPLIRISVDAPTQYHFNETDAVRLGPLRTKDVQKGERVARRRRSRRTYEGEAERISSPPTRISSPVSLKSSHYGHSKGGSRAGTFDGGFYEGEPTSGAGSIAGSMTGTHSVSGSEGGSRHNFSSIFSEGGLLSDAAAAVAAVSRVESSRFEPTRTLPTKEMVHVALAGLKSYREQRILQRMVARRRRFVLQCWGSGGLFFFTAFVGSGMCALEGWDPITMCNRHVSFSFLYMSFACIFGLGISNVVMETHFEPLAFFPRVERQRQLIVASALALFFVLVCVAWPTYWAQQNVDYIGSAMQQQIDAASFGIDGVQEGKPYSWFQVSLPGLCALLAWQAEVVVSQRRAILQWVRDHTKVQTWRVRSTKEMTRRAFTWVSAVVSHLVPLQMALSCVALAQYMETFTPGLLLVGLGPTMFIIAVLACILFVDYDRRGQFVDGAAAVSLALLWCTGFWLLVVSEPRGLCLMPMFLASVGFLYCQLQTLLNVVDDAIVGAEMVGLD